MIELTFTNVPDGGTSSVNIKNVRSVAWSSFADENVFVDETTRAGKRRRQIIVNGFINKTMFGDNLSAQEQLETNLRSVGSGRITYTGMSDLVQVRFVSLEFTEYRGNPISEFSITFISEEDSVHAHSSNKIGSITLNSSNGYEEPTVRETIRAQGTDEQIVNNKSRTFVIEGDFVGTTLDEINTFQAALVAEIENKDTLVLTLSSASGTPGAYTVRSQRIEFGAPKLKDNRIARKYTYEAVTHDDYTKEPYTFGEVVQTFGGIQIDVVRNVDHNVERDKNDVGAIYVINNETLNVQGKKYFSSWTAWKTFVDLFRPIPGNTYLFSSPTGVTLELVDVNIGEFKRDGNFSADNSKRYSAEVTLDFRWIKSYQNKVFEYVASHFGVNWYEVESVSFSTTVNEKGFATSKSVNVSGTLLSATEFNNLKGKVGTKADYDTTFKDLYISSVTVNSIKTVNAPGAGVLKLHSVSVSASQLNTASQAFQFLSGIFKMSQAGGSGTGYSTEQILLDNITNRSKSIANRYNSSVQKFTVTSITISITGDVFDNDSNSKPSQPSKTVDLFNKIDALLNAEASVQGGANVHSGGVVLPDNADIHFFLNNVSVGSWEPFIDEATGARRWKQTISLSATAVFDLAGSADSQPDTVESRSESITLESPKYQQLQLLAFGTVFKRIGTTPEKLTVSYQKRWKNEELYRKDNLSGLDFGSDNVAEGGWRGAGKNVKTKDQKENRGLTNVHTVEYTANQKLG